MKLPFVKGPTLEAAEAKVEQLVAAVAQWRAEETTAAAEADDLSGRIGSLALDDPDGADRAAVDLVALRSRVSVARAAAAEAERRLDPARCDVLRARAGVLRDRADRLERAVAVRRKRADAMLARLVEYELCEFVSADRAAGPVGPGGGRREFAEPLTQVIGRHAARLRADADKLDALTEPPKPLPPLVPGGSGLVSDEDVAARQRERDQRDREALDGWRAQLDAVVAKTLPERTELDAAVADDGSVVGGGRFNRLVRQSL